LAINRTLEDRPRIIIPRNKHRISMVRAVSNSEAGTLDKQRSRVPQRYHFVKGSREAAGVDVLA
jgi:hypothetical protein